MGIPALFRWISEKYPKIMSTVIEEPPRLVDDNFVPVDSSGKNPNGIEIDNLYLDMNGIIHPCCHPEDKKAPDSEDEMYIEIFKYIDRIFAMIRPRKVLYMAIDGVAPRAKMNQQRSRRFRASQEELLKIEDEEKVRRDLGLEFNEFNDVHATKKEHFDSNCITPGTPFMDQLATCLRYYIIDRMNSDPGWKELQVILSDASVPGEGEHKIMDYIRHQKSLSTYDPNTKHVLYGLDADLIMLALATHEPLFWILREEVTVKTRFDQVCSICGQSGHSYAQCTGAIKEKVGKYDDQTKYQEQKPFLFVHISVLREYLDVEMKLQNIGFEWDLERAIDDWVFMCFFVGNDFLPHLPSLEIREGALESLIEIWKNQARGWDGYLTDSGEISLAKVEGVMEELGKIEDKTFQDRRAADERRRLSRLERKKGGSRLSGNLPRSILKNESFIQEQMKDLPTFAVTRTEAGKAGVKRRFGQTEPSFSHRNPEVTAKANIDAAKKLKLQLLAKMGRKESVKEEEVKQNIPTKGFSMNDFKAADDNVTVKEEIKVLVEEDVKEEVQEEEDLAEENDDEEIEEEVETGSVEIPHSKPAVVDSDEEAPQDDVRLWEDGWKSRYYETKFNVDLGNLQFRKEVVKSYVEGLCWVLKYYYQGVQSWKWYYPYHYSPFASDFVNVTEQVVEFEKSTPFRPIEQLLGVFPAASRKHIPAVFHHLMTSPDSPIIDFYPVEFPIDLNGKKYAWQGVALLPFIDADRLLRYVEPLYDQLDEEERRRNGKGEEVIFTPALHPNYEMVCALYSAPLVQEAVALDPYKAAMAGRIFRDAQVTLPGSTAASPLLEFNYEDIQNMKSISANYFLPDLTGYRFTSQLLPKVEAPRQILDENDRYLVRNGLTGLGGRGGRGRGRGRSGASGRMIRAGLGLGVSIRESFINSDSRNQSDRYNDHGNSRDYSSSQTYESRGGQSSYSRREQSSYNSREQSYYNSRENVSYGSRVSSSFDNRGQSSNARGQVSYGSSRDQPSNSSRRRVSSSYSSREQSYETRSSSNSYGERRRDYKDDRDRYGGNNTGGVDRNRNERDRDREYDRRSQPTPSSTYMGGGGYVNFNRDGKYLGNNNNGEYAAQGQQRPAYPSNTAYERNQQNYPAAHTGQPPQNQLDSSAIVANLLSLLPGGSKYQGRYRS